MRLIFDLDHTVIDSSHRQLTLADGSLDLAHWIENNTREKILADSLLPLAAQWRDARKRGAEIVVCTARVIGAADLEFLDLHGLEYDAMLSRTLGDSSPDHLLKEAMLWGYALENGESWARFCRRSIMLDDNKNVIKHLREAGLRVYNAISINQRLSA